MLWPPVAASRTPGWASIQQAFLPWQPGTPTERPACVIANENRSAWLGVLTSRLLPSGHFTFPVALGDRCVGSRAVPLWGPGLAPCAYLYSCFCLTPCSPKIPLCFDPHLTLSFYVLSSNLSAKPFPLPPPKPGDVVLAPPQPLPVECHSTCPHRIVSPPLVPVFVGRAPPFTLRRVPFGR